jgi:uncharacterized protein YjbI with pentapeptide repeats
LVKVKLVDADLRQANLEGCFLYNVEITNADFSNAKLLNIDYSEVQWCNATSFSGAKLDPNIETYIKQNCPEKLQKPK